MPIFDRYFVRENPFDIHRKCWKHCKTIMPKLIAGIIIIYFLQNAVPQIIGYFIPRTYVDVVSHFWPVDSNMKAALPQTPVVFYIYALFLNGALKLGEALYVLTVLRTRRVELGAIVEGFSVYRKAATLYILQIFIITFWSMFFVVPGIMAAINLSMTFFILAENPEKGVLEIIAESRMMMQGNRMYLVRLFITYSPVLFISALPGAIVARTGLVSDSTLAGLMVLIALDLILYAALGYFTVTEGVLYELIRSHGFRNFRYAGQDVFRGTDSEQDEVNE